MTITEFLLARIAEDEKTVDFLYGEWGSLRDAERLERECKAKRKALEAAWQDHLDLEGEFGLGRSREELEWVDNVPEVVAALAGVYADHPDYDPAWA